jgi:hypothetical protein
LVVEDILGLQVKVDHTLVVKLKDILGHQVKVDHTLDLGDILGLQVEVSRTLVLEDNLDWIKSFAGV